MLKSVPSSVYEVMTPGTGQQTNSRQNKQLTPTVHKRTLDTIPPRIIQLIQKIQNHGYSGYLVGGCVRDMLTGIKPKDFDLATNARPKQLLKIFPGKSVIIGRRFPIVHVLCGQHRIEVTTFRGTPAKQSPYMKTSRSGQILIDNYYGTESEDAFRRDLTINALYYDPIHRQVIDYVDGIQDIESQRISIIGKPCTRFREDPIRMLRCIRLGNKLDFTINKSVADSITRNAELIRTATPARLFEELLKMSLCGQAYRNFEHMIELQLFQSIFAPLYDSMTSDTYLLNQSRQLFEIALRNTDHRIARKQPVTPSFLLAVLLWPNVRKILGDSNTINRHQIQLAGYQVIQNHYDIFRIPRRFCTRMLNFWQMQYDLQWPVRTSVKTILSKHDFRAAFDLLAIREQSGEIKNYQPYQWWNRLQRCSENTRNDMIVQLPKRKSRTITPTLMTSYFTTQVP